MAFFQPIDTRNERLEVLLSRPGVSHHRHGPAHYARLVRALEAIVARWPSTTFVGAHAGCFPEDLAWVGQMMDRYANFYIDIGAQAAELGRRPRASARLFEAHPTRILFGTDIFPLNSEQYHVYFRMLETDDEYFNYSPAGTGRWTISGFSLTDGTLERIYRENAKVLLGDAIR
jgi:predicted TIM-barrel fold metal-dependent hydrolase